LFRLILLSHGLVFFILFYDTYYHYRSHDQTSFNKKVM
jgi:hypothetical protein